MLRPACLNVNSGVTAVESGRATPRGGFIGAICAIPPPSCVHYIPGYQIDGFPKGARGIRNVKSPPVIAEG